MGRVSQPPGVSASGRPDGQKWAKFRRTRLLGRDGVFRNRPCWYCGHGAAAPETMQVEHRISPLLRPDLAWAIPNLRPAHAGGKYRCPDCGLACNIVAAGPAVPKDEHGRTLPFTPEVIAAAQARRAAGGGGRPYGTRPVRGGRPGASAKVSLSAGHTISAPALVTVPDSDAGRDW